MWRTGKGLVIGDSLSRVRSLYPRTSKHGIAWWLISAYHPIYQERVGILSAYVRGGHVVAFYGWIGAAGE
jgi:hypothetical protein